MSWCRRVVSIFYREIAALHDAEVVVVGGLATRNVDNEEFWGHVRDALAFREEGWHHLVRFRCPHDKLLAIFRVTKHTCVDERLALIAHHVAVNFSLLILKTHDSCDKLGYLDPDWVIKRVHLLISGCPLDLVRRHNSVLIDFSDDLSDTLEV